MADYDKDMAEERIQIKDDKQKIYQDDKEKKDTAFSMKDPLYMSDELTEDGPVIDQMKSLSQVGAMKVLKHSKSRI